MVDYPMFDLLAVSNHVHDQIMGMFAWFDMWLCYKDMYHVIYTLHLLFYLFKSDKMRVEYPKQKLWKRFLETIRRG